MQSVFLQRRFADDNTGIFVMRILFDISNLGATGPEVLFRNLLPSLAKLAVDDEILLLLPSSRRYDTWDMPSNVKLHFVKRSNIREFRRMWDINGGLARLARIMNADLYFTFGDVGPSKLSIPHVIYLHQPYMVYTESELDNALPLMERIKLRYQRWHFSRSARNATAVVVQTPVMAERVAVHYKLPRDKVHVIYPPLPSHVQKLREKARETSSQAASGVVSLLFLATYYAHKNHSILPELVAELRRRNLSGKVQILLTLDGDRRKEETALLSVLEPDSELICNLGRLTPSEVGVKLATSDALFLPTLVETFGLIYLEAMAAGKPILTSDRDFARYICGDLAIYFDPHNPMSIADAIETLIEKPTQIRYRTEQEADQQISSVAGTPESNATELLSLFYSFMSQKEQL